MNSPTIKEQVNAPTNKWLLVLEMIFLFAVLPSLYYFKLITVHFILMLTILAVGAAIWLNLRRGYKRPHFGLNGFKRWGNLVPLFVAFVIVTTALVYFVIPDQLFIIPRQKPLLWVAILFFYPVFSAYPQELLFRGFFIERYSVLFRKKWMLIVVNGLLFGMAHLMFGHWVSVILSTIGGMFFAWLYLRRRAIGLVSIVHGFYGNWLFTVGLGRYFYLIHGPLIFDVLMCKCADVLMACNLCYNFNDSIV